MLQLQTQTTIRTRDKTHEIYAAVLPVLVLKNGLKRVQWEFFLAVVRLTTAKLGCLTCRSATALRSTW